MTAGDVGDVAGRQDFVNDAALDLIYVADHGRMGLVPASQRSASASTTRDRRGRDSPAPATAGAGGCLTK